MKRDLIVNDSIVASAFSGVYPTINKYLIENGESVDSRYGHTKEILNFKTTLTSPYHRCVGGCGRDINIFFLLAEALWIFKGERDVEFLTMFNERMAEFSDNGKVFHAPYGFRLRHYGVDSNFKFEDGKESSQLKLGFGQPEKQGHHIQQMMDGTDQVLECLKMLKDNHFDRRAVMSIWNTELDLGTKSKDIPCNDMVFLKIRNGRLHTTIANRSNDLHWGLPTNVFQFSFLTEIMSNILEVQLGTQTHNSQSLHFYTDNDIAMRMYEHTQFAVGNSLPDLYDNHFPARMDMRFNSESIEGRLHEVDSYIGLIIKTLKSRKRMDSSDFNELTEFSKYLALVYDILELYLDYKELLNDDEKRMISKDEFRYQKTKELADLSQFYPSLDILALAANFFVTRIKNQDLKKQYIDPIGKL